MAAAVAVVAVAVLVVKLVAVVPVPVPVLVGEVASTNLRGAFPASGSESLHWYW